MIEFRDKAHFDKEILVVFLTEEQWAGHTWPEAIPEQRRWVPDGNSRPYVNSKVFAAKAKQILPVWHNGKWWVLAGLGPASALSPTQMRITTRQALNLPLCQHTRELEIIPSQYEESSIQAILEGIKIGTYTWCKYKTPTDNTPDPRTFFLVAPREVACETTMMTCDGVNLARDLVNDNADIVTAVHFETVIQQLVGGHANVQCEILDAAALQSKGLELHLAVNRGSDKEPRLIIVHYQGKPEDPDCTALVGKGITFDTGGLNLKPTGSIEAMRCDMAGAAAVAGVLRNCLELQLPRNVVFAFGLAENAIGRQAYKPGDVIKSYSGKTVEVGNTDAEGRLVLADAIAYVSKNYVPTRVIDIATLTGACIVALGYDYSGLIANDENLARDLLEAARASDDRAWRLPSYPELAEALKSEIADLRNLGFPKGAAGTLTAAEFLRQFAGDRPWAHLDIAGTAFYPDKGRSYFAAGATGAGVRLLTRFLMQ